MASAASIACRSGAPPCRGARITSVHDSPESLFALQPQRDIVWLHFVLVPRGPHVMRVQTSHLSR
jgi:hypothetical protein